MKIQRHLTPDGRAVSAALQPDGSLVELSADLFAPGGPVPTGRAVTSAKLLFPLVPRSILGIGANYRALFTGQGKPLPEYPIVFFKCHNTLQHPGDPVVLPRLAIQAETVKFEGELCVVIGRAGKNIPASDAMSYVFGYTIANDVSASDWQQARVGNQWCKGKGFDTFCPLGPILVTADEIPDPAALRVVTRVNGVVEQDESVAEMCFNVAELIAFLSAGHTLQPGDIILTGTPPGARFLQPGDSTAITIDPLGTLQNPWIAEA
jgi:2-keto-4-pentenoate hydratase/2-oxohepta-3-ene-1,7-dioic acid hydratase in catechol pathway